MNIWLAILFLVLGGLMSGIGAGWNERVVYPAADDLKVRMVVERENFPWARDYVFHPISGKRIP